MRQKLKALVRNSRLRLSGHSNSDVHRGSSGIDRGAQTAARPTNAQERTASIIHGSGLFDAANYEGRDAAERAGLSAVMHYVMQGEAFGFSPSRDFDPEFYAARYPELGDLPINLFEHFIAHGSMEGRSPLPVAATLRFPEIKTTPNRSTVLLIAHEASRTGAPILAWNLLQELRKQHDVLVLLLGGGELISFFRTGAVGVIGPLDPDVGRNSAEARFIVREVIRRYEIEYVIANSVETRAYAVEFTRQMVPVVALVHEFSSYTRPKGVLQELFSFSDELVFSAELVRRLSATEYKVLQTRRLHVIPQGPSKVPRIMAASPENETAEATGLRALRGEGNEDAFLVIGMGTVQHRKGVDLFISAAASAVAAAPDRKFRFVWFGHGYRPDADVQYSAYLAAQIELSGLSDCLEIRDPVADLSSVYEQMDLMALTSRLDPLPNVALDAALAGIPIVCFEHASGFADLLQADEATSELVVPHLDSTKAGELVANLVEDRGRRERLAAALRELAMRTFQMDAYVAQIAELGRHAAARTRQRRRDAKLIRDERAFDADFYRSEALSRLSDEAALSHYLSNASNVGILSHPEGGVYARRPVPGFHPLRFARDAMASQDRMETDPLAEYLRRGRPAGAWAYPVISPPMGPVPQHHDQRVALHGHFHYPDLVPELLACLESNRLSCDLFLTTNSEEGRQSVRAASRRYLNGQVDIRCVVNRGRDIGPFLTEFASVAEDYDIVGHIHGKRSVHVNMGAEAYGDRWRRFLWQHLIGPDHAMADTILDQFASDAKLGLVFPEDPHLAGWDSNRAIADDLASRMGVPKPLPDFFTFPVGTMFWARSSALRPLFDLNLDWDDYPAEPLAGDGTTLHALERLVPFAVEVAGYRFATTHIPGIVR